MYKEDKATGEHECIECGAWFYPAPEEFGGLSHCEDCRDFDEYRKRKGADYEKN